MEKKKRRSRLVTGKNGELLVASPKAWLYLLPPLIVFVAFVFYPMLAVLRTAFYEKYVYIISKGTGFGLASFKYVLNDKTFWLACKNTGRQFIGIEADDCHFQTAKERIEKGYGV